MDGRGSFAPSLRCPLCAGLAHAALHGSYLRCRLCALGFDPAGPDRLPLASQERGDGTQRHAVPNWNNWRWRLGRGLKTLPGGAPYFSPLSLWMLAARDGRCLRALRSTLPGLTVLAPWRFGEMLHASTVPETSAARVELTLGVIAGRGCEPDLEALGVDASAHVAEMIVVLDTPESSEAAKLQARLRARGVNARVAGHELQADFAAQRNRVQAQARTAWVLQLDCDERLTPHTWNRIQAILGEAERQGWQAVALARRNLVDGRVSALYPDVQYRLVRRDVRYARNVHEYPALGRGQRSFVHLGATILHRLDSARFDRREAAYERMTPGAGRKEDGALLRRPLDVPLPPP